jgi:hypothetical protein
MCVSDDVNGTENRPLDGSHEKYSSSDESNGNSQLTQ